MFLESVDALEYTTLLHLEEHGSFEALYGLLIEQLGEEKGVAKAGAWLAGWVGKALLADPSP